MSSTTVARLLLAVAIIYLAYGCAGLKLQQRKDYYMAVREHRYGDAYRIITEICSKSPRDIMCSSRKKVARKYAAQRLEALKGRIEKTPEPTPVDTIEQLQAELEEIVKISPDVDTSGVKALIDGRRRSTEKLVAELTANAERAAEAGNIKEALKLYKDAASLDSTKKGLAEQYRERVLSSLYDEALKAEKAQNWRLARRVLQTINDIDPAYRDVATRLKAAEKKDTYSYHVEEAERALRAGDTERALRMAELALTYRDDSQTRKLMHRILAERVRRLIRRALELYQEDHLLSAGAQLVEAIKVVKRLPYEERRRVSLPSHRIKGLIEEMFLRAKQLWRRGERELAYLYLQIVGRIEPDYPGLSPLKERWAQELERHALPTVAVIPFKGPSYNIDAGNTIATRILHYLYTELSKDVRILERSAMEAIIKEKEVQALQGGELRRDILSLIGADYLIIGNVTDYRVESSRVDSFKTIRVKVASKKVPATGGTTEGGKPGGYVEEPVYENIRYRISHHKKIATIVAGWRVVDSSGNIVYVDVVEKKLVKSAEGREGVSVGEVNIEEKLPELPTDSELLKEVEDRVVAAIGGKLKELFAGAEARLIERAEELQSKGNLRGALALLVRARFVAESKGTDTRAIQERIDRILARGKL